MKELTLFYLPGCPHCKLALRLVEELMAEEPRYREIPIQKIDESREKALAESYDYWYVPCFFDGRKEEAVRGAYGKAGRAEGSGRGAGIIGSTLKIGVWEKRGSITLQIL